MEKHHKLLEPLFSELIGNVERHKQWLATLSYLENQGARKIFACQPQGDLPLELLQHAAEEARHAWFFKKQIERLDGDANQIYPLLGGYAARHYLHRLDMGICRILKKELGLAGRRLKDASYLLTTYGIEVRAAVFYPHYHEVLQAAGIKISLNSIIREEDRHLDEIESSLQAWPEIQALCQRVIDMENVLYERFIDEVCRTVLVPASINR